jgi:myo-inositol-1-phosphate synthase
MSPPRIGVWFIGARGGVAATATLGLLALAKGHAGRWRTHTGPDRDRRTQNEVGLVSALPPFAALDLVPWHNIVIGGHDVRACHIADAALTLVHNGALKLSLVEEFSDALNQIDSHIEFGVLFNSGQAIERLSGEDPPRWRARKAVEKIKKDLANFASGEDLDRVVVVNVASTEPPTDTIGLPERWDDLEKLLDADTCPLRASSLYAIAALDLGMPYVNFTPSLGASHPAIQELAVRRRTCHAGQDGKTGETLLKSILAPMFAARNLEVMSWVGHNIFGNLDGLVLEDPANKSAKMKSKDQLVGSILGYDPQTLVSIEYIRSLGDWKTAWDHIHFRGFLGTPMSLQFTWQGCDSLLAAPLVLDLVRFVELAHRHGEVGVLTHLGSFFKQPLGLAEHDFSRQFSLLCEWAAARSNRKSPS